MCNQIKQQQDFEFLLHEYDGARNEVMQISERRYNLVIFYFGIITAIVSAIGFVFRFAGENEWLACFFAVLAVFIGIVFLIIFNKEQLSITRNLNKVNGIRKFLDLKMIRGWTDKDKRDIYMDTEYLDKRQNLNDNQFWNWISVTRVMSIVILLVSLCFFGFIFVKYWAQFVPLFAYWKELFFIIVSVFLFIVLSVAFYFAVR